MSAEFAERRRTVRIDRAGAKPKDAGDLAAGFALADRPGDLCPARGKHFPLRVTHRDGTPGAHRDGGGAQAARRFPTCRPQTATRAAAAVGRTADSRAAGSIAESATMSMERVKGGMRNFMTTSCCAPSTLG
jgi:hypothetical protein